MKNALIVCSLLFISFNLSAQDLDRKARHEKIKELKIAFITERLNLTSNEAQKFWPIYNEFESSYNDLRKDSNKARKSANPDELNEAEAKLILNDISSIEDKKHQLKSQYIQNLLTAIPAKKIILLKKAEDDFNKRMIEEFKRRRQEKRDKTP